MTAASFGDWSELFETISLTPAQAGELDLAIEDVANKSIPDVSLRRSARGVGS